MLRGLGLRDHHRTETLKPNHTVRGSVLPEPIKMIATVPKLESVKLIAEGLTTGQVHQPIRTPGQIAELEIAPEVALLDS